MLNKIMVPLDGSEMFSETLDYLRELGDLSTTEIALLHVQEPGATVADGAAHPVLKGYHEALQKEGWQVRAELRSGDTVEEVAACAAQENPTLLVMSTHGRSGIESIREGSVTEQVVRQSPCPVFILHSTRADSRGARPGNLFHRMLVPLDGSEVSAAIMPCVEHFAKRYHSDVVLFHDHPDCEESEEAGKRREFIGHHGVELANAGIAVQLDCSTHRHPVREILERMEQLDIDVVAMVTHGENGERRALEESVTANVMRHASRPLLVWSSDPQCARAIK